MFDCVCWKNITLKCMHRACTSDGVCKELAFGLDSSAWKTIDNFTNFLVMLSPRILQTWSWVHGSNAFVHCAHSLPHRRKPSWSCSVGTFLTNTKLLCCSRFALSARVRPNWRPGGPRCSYIGSVGKMSNMLELFSCRFNCLYIYMCVYRIAASENGSCDSCMVADSLFREHCKQTCSSDEHNGQANSVHQHSDLQSFSTCTWATFIWRKMCFFRAFFLLSFFLSLLSSLLLCMPLWWLLYVPGSQLCMPDSTPVGTSRADDEKLPNAVPSVLIFQFVWKLQVNYMNNIGQYSIL